MHHHNDKLTFHLFLLRAETPIQITKNLSPQATLYIIVHTLENHGAHIFIGGPRGAYYMFTQPPMRIRISVNELQK